MARPRNDDPENKATIKIENAFWHLLESESYRNITVRKISQESGTNRNAFYYHYRDIDDLADKAFDGIAGSEASEALMSVLLSEFNNRRRNADLDRVKDPSVLIQSKRIMLCAGSDSVYLKRKVQDILRGVWLGSFSIREELLSVEERLQISFIFAGLVDILGNKAIQETPLSMLSLSQSEIGQAIINTMRSISESQGKNDHI